tara:strand:+ start:746 stop:1210 length:465 start_codon:yes stop_codon:yes gene_type:complete
MPGINKVILIGRLGAKPEYKQFDNGGSKARFNLATSEKWNDKNTGEKKERTEWHRVILWNKLADIGNQYLSKGSQVYIEGKLENEEYQDKQGITRRVTQVVVNSFGGSMQMLDSKRQPTQNTDPQREAPPIETKPQQPAIATSGDDEFEDEIPF